MQELRNHRTHVTTIADLLLDAADRVSERAALIFPDRRHTYATLVEASYQRARSLYAMGVGPGDHVGILMANCLEYMELLMQLHLLCLRMLVC